MITERQFLLILMLFLVIRNPGYSAPAHSGQVRIGEVPVPGVAIQAVQGDKNLQAITDSNGAYSFDALTDGIWTIYVRMQGFVPIRHDLKIEAEAVSTVWELEMLPMSAMQTEKAPGFEPGFAFTPSPDNRFPTLEIAEPALILPLNAPRLPDGTQHLSNAFLINGSVSDGESTAFGNNRRSEPPLYTGDISITANSSAFDASSYSLTGQSMPKAGYTRTGVSVVLSGPLQVPAMLRHGPRITVSYGRAQSQDVNIQAARVPTLVERSGDFSQSLNVVKDPATGIPFPDHIIPGHRISSQAKALLNLYPVPNFTEGAPHNYQVHVASVTHRDNLQLDAGGIAFGNQLTIHADFQSNRTDSHNILGFSDRLNNSSFTGVLSWSRRFSERFSSSANYSLSRTVSHATPYFAYRENVSGDAGIAGNDQNPRNWGPPNLNFSGGIASLFNGQYAFDRTQSSAISYNGTWNDGSHNVSFGIGFRRVQLNLLSNKDARGTFTFTGAASGNDFADFLLGIPAASTISFGNPDRYFRHSFYDAYLMDDWRITSSLTLNLGLRWEYEEPVTELYGRLANLDIDGSFQSAAPVLAGQSRGAVTDRAYSRSLVRSDKKGIQPRFGLAWRPQTKSSLVIRFGYGIYRDTSVYRAIAGEMAYQFPFSTSLSVENSSLTSLTLANGFKSSPLNTSNTFAVNPGFRVAYVQNWQFSIQHDLPAALQVAAMYLGVRGIHLQQRSLPNTFPPGASNLCLVCPIGFVYLTSYGNSHQHAGTIELRRRQRNGFAASLRYTWAKAMDDAGLGEYHLAQDWRNQRSERALSTFDRRHQVTAQFRYSTGMLTGIGAPWSRWIGILFRDWDLMTEVRAGSGSPLTPVLMAPAQGTGITGSLRPDRTGAPLYLNASSRLLNPEAFAAPVAGKWGNAARHSIPGPGYISCDASIGRAFRREDGISIDLRVDVTNILNHVTFPSWNTVVNSTQFGLPTRAGSMRIVQPSLWVRF